MYQVVKNLPANSGNTGKRLGFNSWVEKIPWWRKWQLTPVFLPRKERGAWWATIHGVAKESDPNEHRQFLNSFLTWWTKFLAICPVSPPTCTLWSLTHSHWAFPSLLFNGFHPATGPGHMLFPLPKTHFNWWAAMDPPDHTKCHLREMVLGLLSSGSILTALPDRSSPDGTLLFPFQHLARLAKLQLLVSFSSSRHPSGTVPVALTTASPERWSIDTCWTQD